MVLGEFKKCFFRHSLLVLVCDKVPASPCAAVIWSLEGKASKKGWTYFMAGEFSGIMFLFYLNTLAEMVHRHPHMLRVSLAGEQTSYWC